jgi:hypothetical protein
VTEKPGRVGRSYPVTQSAANNSAPTAQASITNDRVGIIALILGIVAVVLAVVLLLSVWSISRDVESVRGLIESSAQAASDAATEAARAAERASNAERSAAINREYAVQVVGQLNRMGYPVMSPGEKDHPLAQPEDYAKLDTFAEQQKEQP